MPREARLLPGRPGLLARRAPREAPQGPGRREGDQRGLPQAAGDDGEAGPVHPRRDAEAGGKLLLGALGRSAKAPAPQSGAALVPGRSGRPCGQRRRARRLRPRQGGPQQEAAPWSSPAPQRDRPRPRRRPGGGLVRRRRSPLPGPRRLREQARAGGDGRAGGRRHQRGPPAHRRGGHRRRQVDGLPAARRPLRASEQQARRRIHQHHQPPGAASDQGRAGAGPERSKPWRTLPPTSSGTPS